MRFSTLLHLRLPFSFFLLPIYLAGLWGAGGVDPTRAILVFAVLHLLVYPASNGFNSYFDRDEGPIGGLESPPPVSPELLVTALVLDALGLGLAFLAGPLFALAVFIYGGFSKLYSAPPVRLKRRPIAGWLATGLGQGGLTCMAVVIGTARMPGSAGLPGVADLLAAATTGPVLALAAGFTLLLLGVYPLTQVYQHGEDGRRGDRTMSMLVGIRGTFILAAACLGLAVAVLGGLLALRAGPGWAALFLALQAPSLIILLAWARAVWRDPAAADWRRAMRMNLTASAGMNLFFAILLIAT